MHSSQPQHHASSSWERAIMAKTCGNFSGARKVKRLFSRKASRFIITILSKYHWVISGRMDKSTIDAVDIRGILCMFPFLPTFEWLAIWIGWCCHSWFGRPFEKNSVSDGRSISRIALPISVKSLTLSFSRIQKRNRQIWAKRISEEE